MNKKTLIEYADQINQAISALIETEAMKAENKKNELNGDLLSWGFTDFQNVLEGYGLGYSGCALKAMRFKKSNK